MKTCILLLVLLLTTSFAPNARAAVITSNNLIYQKNTPSLFPADVKNFANKMYSGADIGYGCNATAKYVIVQETIQKKPGKIDYHALLHVYGEKDHYTNDGMDENGVPYRVRAFQIRRDLTGALDFVFFSCEASSR